YPDQATAADVLNSLDVPSLVKIFKIYGEEKQAKKIAQALFDAKYMLKTINTTHELAELVQSTLGSEQRFDKLQRTAHVATKIFQALRIFINDELNELNYAMEMAHLFLKPGGRIAVLTFHSLEDRIVKRHFLGIHMDEPVSHTLRQKYKNAFAYHSLEDVNEVTAKRWHPLHKNVITPTSDEIESNPRSRSAKLRVAEKILETPE
ncbi:putative methyltransferase-like protein 15, partial [Araneus ventricosus]